MSHNRHLQTALTTALLLVAGAACSTSATSPPAEAGPLAVSLDVEPDAPPAVDEQPTPAASTPDPVPDPVPDPEPTPDPQPTPDPVPPPAPADLGDDTAPDPEPDPDPDPDPLDLAPPADPDPDPDPEPRPPVIDPVIVANIPACGLYLPIPDNAASVSSVVVDAAGDGSADDTVTSYYDVDDGQWRVRLIPALGGVSEVTVSGVGPGYVEALGAVHVDTDDAEQILAVVGAGAAAHVLGVFGADADGCLFQFTWHGSAEPVTFAVGATVGNMSGLQCYESDGWRYLSSISAVSNGPGTGTWNIYGSDAPRESEQTLLAGDGIHVFGVPDGDPQLAAVPTVDCPGITL